MAELTADMTYGTALYEAALETGNLERIREDAVAVKLVMDEEEELRKFVAFPSISAEEKKKVLGNIFEGRICEELLNFLYVLVDNRRMREYPRIVKVFCDMADHEEGVAYGTLYSVVPLDEKRIAEIEKDVSGLMKEKVSLTNEVDESLIAGFKILIEGKVIDASYRKRFHDMASRLNIQ